MIELTDEQVRALSTPQASPPRLVNPRTKEAFVLLRVDEYKRLTEEKDEKEESGDAYDDSPWTREELQSLAWDTASRAGWDGEDDVPAKP